MDSLSGVGLTLADSGDAHFREVSFLSMCVCVCVCVWGGGCMCVCVWKLMRRPVDVGLW